MLKLLLIKLSCSASYFTPLCMQVPIIIYIDAIAMLWQAVRSDLILAIDRRERLSHHLPSPSGIIAWQTWKLITNTSSSSHKNLSPGLCLQAITFSYIFWHQKLGIWIFMVQYLEHLTLCFPTPFFDQIKFITFRLLNKKQIHKLINICVFIIISCGSGWSVFSIGFQFWPTDHYHQRHHTRGLEKNLAENTFWQQHKFLI